MTIDKLKNLRSKIDKIDKDLLKLIQMRASLAVDIGKIKSKISPNTSFYKPDREANILRNILKANEDGALLLFQLVLPRLLQPLLDFPGLEKSSRDNVRNI